MLYRVSRLFKYVTHVSIMLNYEFKNYKYLKLKALMLDLMTLNVTQRYLMCIKIKYYNIEDEGIK